VDHDNYVEFLCACFEILNCGYSDDQTLVTRERKKSLNELYNADYEQFVDELNNLYTYREYENNYLDNHINNNLNEYNDTLKLNQ